MVKDSLGEEVEFVKVAMQPGMPQGAGRVEPPGGDIGPGTPIITLPGNPVSALVSFEVFIRPPCAPRWRCRIPTARCARPRSPKR